MKEQLNGSSEVRWFFELDNNESCLDWFFQGLPDRRSEEFQPARHYEDKRVDDYLVLPGSQVVGVKLREETKLEVKAVVSHPSPVNFGTYEGHYDQWIKWTCESEALKAALEFRCSDNWQSVVKCRYLRKFSADFEKMVEVVPSRKPLPASGLNVEFTLLEVNTFWRGFSFGFESFGPKLNSLNGLTAGVLFFVQAQSAANPMSLTRENSLNFPSWISSINNRVTTKAS